MATSIFSMCKLTKIIQISFINQHILDSTNIFKVRHHGSYKQHGKKLFQRAKTIWSTEAAFNEQSKNIKKFMSWNSYPKHVHESLLKRLHSNTSTLKEQTDDQRKNVKLNLPYLDVWRDHLSRSLIRKLTGCFNESAKFMKQYKANKLKIFCSTVDSL